MAKNMLEAEFAAPFAQWQQAPTPENSSRMLQVVEPVLSRGVLAHAGPNASPNTKSRARRLALNALKSYDPSQAKLATHLTNHLQGLRRIMRQEQQILSVPEQVSMDAGHLNQRESELEDLHGRSPTAIELADATGLSIRRINKIRQMHQPVAEGTMAASNLTPESEGMLPAVKDDNPRNMQVELLYHELDPTGQKILEHTLGLYGKPVLSNQDLARHLRLTPGAVSQRKAALQRKLDETADLHLF